MGNKNKNKEIKTKSKIKANNDQLGENAYDPLAENYDNKGRNAKEKARKWAFSFKVSIIRIPIFIEFWKSEVEFVQLKLYNVCTNI